MKNPLIKILLGFVFFIAFSAFNSPISSTQNSQSDIPDFCNTKNNTFQDGEELTYKLYYNWGMIWLSAGEVVFKVKDIGNEYYVSAYGSTYSSYEWFFKVRDFYQAYIDKETLLPRTGIRKVQEGNYVLYDKLDYYQNQRMVASTRGKTKGEAKTSEYLVDDCVHDILSVMYYLRNINQTDLKPGTEIPIKIFMDNQVWPLQLSYKGKETNKNIKGLGQFNTIKLIPEVIVGEVFKEGTEMNIYASDDKNRIPLLIESPVSVGSVKVVLKSYKGLKYDLTSKK